MVTARIAIMAKMTRVLIVEDDADIIALLSMGLEKAGFHVETAETSLVGLEKIKENRPDLILSDVMMPQMDGHSFLKAIRENPQTRDIPFIFLTAKGKLDDKVEGLSLGADDYISKPFHIKEVIARINALLQRVQLDTEKNLSLDSDADIALKGNLKQMNLGDIFQTLGNTAKTGILQVTTSNNKRGSIYFHEGKIIRAELGRYSQEEAIYRILSWDEGNFEFDAKLAMPKGDVSISISSVLMEGMRQKDEHVKFKAVMPDYHIPLYITKQFTGTTLFSPIEQKILILISDGETIQSIIDNSPFNYLLTIKILYKFLKKGVIKPTASKKQRVKLESPGLINKVRKELPDESSRKQEVKPESVSYEDLAEELYE